MKKEISPSIQEQQKLLDIYSQHLALETISHAKLFISEFPTHGFGWKILGAVLHDLGRINEAIEVMKKAVQLLPNDVEVFYNYGLILKDKGDLSGAEQNYLNALLIDENYADAYNNLGIIYQQKKNFKAARMYFDKALEFDFNHGDAYINLGNLFADQDKLIDAEQAYCKAFKLIPGNKYASGMRYLMRRSICQWTNYAIDNEELLTCFKTSQLNVMSPFLLLAVENFNLEFLKHAGRLFAEFTYKFQLNARELLTTIVNLNHKLRIGYLSGDFHSHATVYLMAGVLENRNRTEFDVYLYSYGVEQNNDSRSRITNACELFRDVRDLSDEDIAQQILNDEIDVLVDLKGFTQEARLGIQAFRPAPVIVSWLGYPGTLGHERLADYIIGDATVTPLDHAEYYSETLAIMPHCYQPNDNKRPIGVAPTRTEVGLPENAFVFCTFNQAYKITPKMFDIWCRLLGAIPESVLWLLEPHPTAQENLRREIEARGIESSRLIFAPKMEQTAHLGRLQLADLAVDTFPYTSHTTASDALWAGVPLVTKMGETFASRVAASILNTMDLSELVTTNDEDYFHVALSLAQNPEKLAAIKQKIAEQKQISPLFDTQKFARDLERLYQTIWEQELKGERKAVVLKSEENPDIGEELKHVELRKSFDGCPLCNSVNTKAIIHADVKNHSLYNDYLPSDLTWLECVECKHVFSQHYWTADGLTQIFKNAHSNQVAGGNPDQKRQTWKPVVQNVLTVMGGFSVLQQMSLKPKWIDIGCGDGGLVMTAAEFGFNSIGFDARMQTVQALIDSGYQSVCGDFMQINIDGEPPYIISMMDVLEYLPNPCEALQRAHSLLHPKGVLVISLPNSDCSSWKLMGNANPYWVEIDHFHNFSRQRLTDLLNKYGFSVVYYDIPFRYKAQMELYAVKK